MSEPIVSYDSEFVPQSDKYKTPNIYSDTIFNFVAILDLCIFLVAQSIVYGYIYINTQALRENFPSFIIKQQPNVSFDVFVFGVLYESTIYISDRDVRFDKNSQLLFISQFNSTSLTFNLTPLMIKL